MRRLLLSSMLLTCPVVALADPPAGQIDPTFGSSDANILGLQLEGFDLGGGVNDWAWGMAEDAQQRLLLAGAGETDNGQCLGLMRFTANGQLDTSDFGYDQNNVAKGKICHSVPLLAGHLGLDMDVVPLTDGGWLVGGIAEFTHPFVCRFLADGRVHGTFGAGTGCVTLTGIDVGGSWPAPDLLVVGTSLLIVANSAQGAVSTPVLSRIALSTGALQPFGQDTFVPLLTSEADAFAWDASLTDDGDLIAVGRIVEDANDLDAFVARFDLQTTTPDTAFSGDGIARFKFNQIPLGQDHFNAVTMLPNGDILAGGDIEMSDSAGLAVVQLDATTGALAPAFNGGVPKLYDPCSAMDGGCSSLIVHEIAATPDHILLAGGAGAGMFAMRLSASGAVDTSFGDQGLARFELAYEATGMVLQDDRIVLSGYVDNGGHDFALLRLSDGRLFTDQFETTAP